MIRNVHKIKLGFCYEFSFIRCQILGTIPPHRAKNLACLSRKFITRKLQFYFVPVPKHFFFGLKHSNYKKIVFLYYLCKS